MAVRCSARARYYGVTMPLRHYYYAPLLLRYVMMIDDVAPLMHAPCVYYCCRYMPERAVPRLYAAAATR